MTKSHGLWVNRGLPPEDLISRHYADSLASWRRGDRKRVLVACERSGRVRDWLRLAGIDAWSNDMRPCDVGGPHLQGDVFNFAGEGWDCILAFPPCTYLSRINVAGRRKHPDREREARAFVARLWRLPVPLMAIENPVGAVWDVLGRPTQQVQPWHFGDPYSKRTCLWLRGLSPLRSASGLRITRIDSWTDVVHTSRGRSRTFHGIAQALAVAVVEALNGRGERQLTLEGLG